MAIKDLSIIKFSNGNENTLKFVDRFRDYYFHYMSKVNKKDLGDFDNTVSLSEKEDKINNSFLGEVQRFAGCTLPNDIQPTHLVANPMIRWAAFAVVDMLIQAVLPETIIRSIGLYTEVRNVGWGDSAQFEIKPRALMTVSTGAHGQRTTIRQKQFSANRTLMPVNHNITVYASLYKVLARKENLAEFVRTAIRSMETAFSLDAYNALNAGLTAATYPTALVKIGYTQDTLLGLCQTVTAYNQGDKAVIVGTSLALSKIIPNAANGYRIVTDSNAQSIQLIKNFFDYDILVLPQVATGDYTNYSLALDDKKIYVVSPSTDKLVKMVLEGVQLSNGNDYYDNANLTSNTTINKGWACEFVSNATSGLVKLN